MKSLTKLGTQILEKILDIDGKKIKTTYSLGEKNCPIETDTFFLLGNVITAISGWSPTGGYGVMACKASGSIKGTESFLEYLTRFYRKIGFYPTHVVISRVKYNKHGNRLDDELCVVRIFAKEWISFIKSRRK